MKNSSKYLAAAITLAVLWGLATCSDVTLELLRPGYTTVPVGEPEAWLNTAAQWTRALSMFAVLFIVPGLGLRRLVGGSAPTSSGPALLEHQFAALSQSFAASLGLVAILAVLCGALGIPSGPALLVTLASCGLFLVFPAANPGHSGSGTDNAHYHQLFWLGLSIATGTALALGGENLGLPALWTFAEASRIDVGGGIGGAILNSSVPIPGATGRAWPAALALWTRAADLDPVFAFERVLPFVLTVLASSASLALCRSLLGAGTASLAAAMSMLALLCSASPHLPASGVFAAHLAQPSMLALCVLAPTTLTALILSYFPRREDHRATTEPLVVGFAIIGLANTLPAAVVLIGITGALLATTAQLRNSTGLSLELSRSRINAFIAIAASAWALPELMSVRALGASSGDPLVEAFVTGATTSMPPILNLTMLGPFGVMLDPRALGHPLFLLALAGAAADMGSHDGRRTSITSALLLTAALTTVIPGTAGVWTAVVGVGQVGAGAALIPTGVLLLMFGERAIAFARGPRWRTVLATALAFSWITFAGMHDLPMYRLGTTGLHETLRGPGADPDLTNLIDEIKKLPDDATLVVAGDLGTLLSAFTGRRMLAADLTTTAVFALDSPDPSSPRSAPQRRLAAATLSGLAGASTALRQQLVAQHDCSHLILQGQECDSAEATIASSGRFRICDLQYLAPAAELAADSPTVTFARSGSGPDQVLATLSDGWTCHPEASSARKGDSLIWTARERWTARPISIHCSLALLPATDSAKVNVLFDEQNLSGSVAYRLTTYSSQNGERQVSAQVALAETPNLAIEINDPMATSLQLILTTGASSLRLQDIELWGRGDFEPGEIEPDGEASEEQ